MVDISHGNPEEVETRLRRVITETRLVVYDKPRAFVEFPVDDFHSRADPAALALVRDEKVWGQLVQCDVGAAEPFALWRFHFSAGADNSGFVGWLATHLKMRFGTGVFVVCGHDSNDGGIFDYWGCPWQLRGEVVDEMRKLGRLVREPNV